MKFKTTIEHDIRGWMGDHTRCQEKTTLAITLASGQVIRVGVGFDDSGSTRLGTRKNRTTRRVTCRACSEGSGWAYWTRRPSHRRASPR